MRIEIYTTNPEVLKSKIFEKTENGDLKTWEIKENDKKEKLLTHTSQWKDAALLSLRSYDKKLTVTVFWWKDQEPNEFTKNIYLGRFSEALLNHFNSYYTSFEIFYK